MKNDRRFSLFALLSLLIAALLLCGYVSRFGLMFTNIGRGPAASYRQVIATLDQGRVLVWCDTYNAPFLGAVTTARVRPVGHLLDLRAPSIRRSLWEFDAHAIPATALASPRASSTIFAFPIWCLLLPSLIAPLLWLRQRRRKEERGFPVDATTPPAAATI